MYVCVTFNQFSINRERYQGFFFHIKIIVQMAFKLHGIFRILLSGSSGSGKTTFVINLINNLENLTDLKYKQIFWFYSELNAKPTTIANKAIKYHQGLPTDFTNSTLEPILVVLDDLMYESSSHTPQVMQLFTRKSHHANISVCLLTQNIFNKGKFTRDISLNATHIVLFKTPRDQQQYLYLFRQICPQQAASLAKIFKEISSEPHSYMFLDLTQSCHDLLRYKFNVFEPAYGSVICPSPLNTTVNGEQVNEICTVEEVTAIPVLFKPSQL